MHKIIHHLKNGPFIGLVFCLFILGFLTWGITPPAIPYSHPSWLAHDNFIERYGGSGHTVERHVGKSDDYLFERLQTEDISAASTFNDMAEANAAVKNVLLKRGDLVREWKRAGRSDKKAFYHKTDRPVGRVLKRGWNAPRPGNEVRMVLVRDNVYATGFYILTAYPSYR